MKSVPPQLVVIFCLLICIQCKNSNSESLKYIDQNKPGTTPQIFAPQFISLESEAEFGSVFNKEGTQFFYAVDKDKKAEIRYTELKDGKWMPPTTLFKNKKYSYNDPFLSPDQSELYFISNQPTSTTDTKKDYNIWFSKRDGNYWSEPISAGENINTDKNEYYISFTKDKTMYFASNIDAETNRSHDYDIFKSQYMDGQFQKPTILKQPISTSRYEADVFIDPNEKYIIFCTAQANGFGKGDLNISFKNENGQWTKPTNMGEAFNSSMNETCPYVTHDGKYFFYSSNGDIYWVSTEVFGQFVPMKKN